MNLLSFSNLAGPISEPQYSEHPIIQVIIYVAVVLIVVSGIILVGTLFSPSSDKNRNSK